MNRRACRLAAVELATCLLGRRLVREHAGIRLAGTIVETEAYPGGDDLGSHSSRGRTNRNASMFEEGGTIYVYRIYGLHHCLNIVSGRRGSGEAVLIRAIRPEEGLAAMASRRGRGVRPRDLCRGPGRLCEAMAIDRSIDGAALGRPAGLWIESPPGGHGTGRVVATPRIGLGEVGAWKARRWRFVLAGPEERPWVSGPSRLLEGGGGGP
jgi:DNA-3-methyladenine glycosylase